MESTLSNSTTKQDKRGEAYMRSFCTTINVAVLKTHPPQNCYAFDSKQYNATLSFTSTLKITKIHRHCYFYSSGKFICFFVLKTIKTTSTVINKCCIFSY